MEEPRDRIYCRHILKAIEEMEAFTAGMDFEGFENDIKTQHAVARELEIIGEAAKRLSEEFKSSRGSIPWRRITGMRDFLIHDYMQVDLKELWKTATEDVKELKLALETE